MTTDDKPAKPDVRFVISTERDNYSTSYQTCTLSVVLVRYEDNTLRVISPGYDHEPTDALQDLIITGQCEWMPADDDAPAPRWYGWEAGFRSRYHVDLDDAKSMFALLTKITRSLRKAEDDSGRPESFAAYALRVARAVGAHESNVFGVRDQENSWDGTGYRWLGADGLSYYLDNFARGKTPATRIR